MKKWLFRKLKRTLTAIGARIPTRGAHQLQMMVNYLKLGRWMRDNGFRVDRRLHRRPQVFAAVADRVRDRRVLYLEFGVHRGASMRFWSSALQHPESHLHGFDSFEGLPEDFDDVGGKYRKGHFDVAGEAPKIDDPRVRFFKGWFHDTLPSYSPPAHDVLVVVLDADLYSSTRYVLEQLQPHIGRGTFLYFDEMSRPEHEPRALREFMEETGRRFRLVAVDQTLNHAFFECLG